MSEVVNMLQALLFVRGEQVTWKEAAKTLGLPDEEIQAVSVELQATLKESALTVLVAEEGLELVTSPKMAEFVAQLEQEEPEELSKAAAETLSIVAYRGPLSRQEVSMIRGVESRAMLRQLVRRSLVKQAQGAAGVVLYDISGEALKQLGIERREDLPDFGLLSSNERLQEFLQEGEH